METLKHSGLWSSLGSDGETVHNEILIFKPNLTLEVKVNHSQKQ